MMIIGDSFQLSIALSFGTPETFLFSISTAKVYSAVMTELQKEKNFFSKNGRG